MDAFLRRSRFSPLKVWRRGERVSARTGAEVLGSEQKHGQSGFAALASAASFRQPAQQAADAALFLKRFEPALTLLAECPGVEAVLLDFGIEDRPLQSQLSALQTNYFPPDLLRLMGNLNIGLVITRYPETAG